MCIGACADARWISEDKRNLALRLAQLSVPDLLRVRRRHSKSLKQSSGKSDRRIIMPNLTYYVSATEGRYGVKSQADLADGQTFGSQGATVCVILLLIKADGNLFCGHMACGIAGLPQNEGTIKSKVQELLNAALGEDNKEQEWKITGSSTDSTNRWIREAMINWFSNPPTVNSNVCTDGFFSNANGNITSTLSNNMSDEGATEVDSGNFSIEP